MVKLLLDRGAQIDAKTRVSVSVLSIIFFLYSFSRHFKIPAPQHKQCIFKEITFLDLIYTSYII